MQQPRHGKHLMSALGGAQVGDPEIEHVPPPVAGGLDEDTIRRMFLDPSGARQQSARIFINLELLVLILMSLRTCEIRHSYFAFSV
jgi:hypothetical protein